MSLVLNEEQRLLQTSAKEFIKQEMPITAFREVRANGNGFDRNTWTKMAELGWAGMVIPEEFDGLDFGFMGLGAVLEQMGKHLAASPIISTVAVASSAIVLAGSQQQKQDLLPKIASGELCIALALEEQAHHQPLRAELTATTSASGFVLNGKKTFVLDGVNAQQLIVVASQPDDESALSLFILDAEASGITRNKCTMIDGRDVADIEFKDVAIDSTALLGELGNSADVLSQILDRGRICIAAEMLGGAQECFERTVEYLKEREQFGVKIGTFQALQHRCAIMYTQLELAKSVVLDALSSLDDNRADIAQLASLAKANVNDVFELVTSEAVQMHGGIGITDELDIGLFLKRSRVCNQIFGNTGFHQDRYASLCGY